MRQGADRFPQDPGGHSVFRYNIDGLRFSTVNFEAAGNLIQNNSHGNRHCQVKLGLESFGNLILPRNWWGTSDPETKETGFSTSVSKPPSAGCGRPKRWSGRRPSPAQ